MWFRINYDTQCHELNGKNHMDASVSYKIAHGMEWGRNALHEACVLCILCTSRVCS